MAAGTVQTIRRGDGGLYDLIMVATASGAAAFTAVLTRECINGVLIKVSTNPGATAPTDAYDITLTDEDGIDVMGGALANRSTTNSEVAYPKDPAGGIMHAGVPVIGKLTLTITNNAVNDATTSVRLTIFRNE